MTTQNNTTVNIGDCIKAYDFQPREDVGERYLVGLVLDKGFMPEVGTHGYTVEVRTQSPSNKEDGIYEVSQTVYVPFKTLFDFDGRISHFDPETQDA